MRRDYGEVLLRERKDFESLLINARRQLKENPQENKRWVKTIKYFEKKLRALNRRITKWQKTKFRKTK
jgi:hypothetical protein